MLNAIRKKSPSLASKSVWLPSIYQFQNYEYRRTSRLARNLMVVTNMLKSQTRRNAERARRAIALLAEIESSVGTLNDNDLLDLADIFLPTKDTPLAKMATGEMARRKLTFQTEDSDI